MIAKRLCHYIFIQACDRGKYSSLFDIFYQKGAEITSFSVGGQCFKWCHGYYFHYCTYACFCQHKSLLTLTSDPTNAATSNAQCYTQHTHENTIRHFHAKRTSKHTIPIRFLLTSHTTFIWKHGCFLHFLLLKKIKNTHNPKDPKQVCFPFGWFPKQTKKQQNKNQKTTNKTRWHQYPRLLGLWRGWLLVDDELVTKEIGKKTHHMSNAKNYTFISSTT